MSPAGPVMRWYLMPVCVRTCFAAWKAFWKTLFRTAPVVPLDRLWEEADIVVECAPAKHLRDIAEPALAHGFKAHLSACAAI